LGKALTTDLYEINMAASYLRRNMVDEATFSLFMRRMPPNRGFLVVAGLEECLGYLETFRFDEEELGYLEQIGFPKESVAQLRTLRFTGDVFAVPEGRVVLANEPLIEVTAPIAEAQIVESYLLNQVTYATSLATKATRCAIGAGEIELFDFALRRTHGTEASMMLARVCAIAGFLGTSNVQAARRFGLTAVGTMAHSYIEAFPAEREAFLAFAEDFPTRAVFLVDTYDTSKGIDTAIDVICELGLESSAGVRIDSGDLEVEAREARDRLDRAGLSSVRIFVSGGLDEYALDRLRRDGAPIDAAGVGAALGVSDDAPLADSAYKLVEVGDRPVMKLSIGKLSLPGRKQVWRSGSIADDVLSTRDEPGPNGAEAMLVPVMRNGRRAGGSDSIGQARARLRSDLDALPSETRQLVGPAPLEAIVSSRLVELADSVSAEIRSRGA